MNQISDAMNMVEYLPQAAFCVRDGIIVKVNTAASHRMIETGMQIEPLLKTGVEEYREFSQGCLYLTLNICDQDLSFSVRCKNGFDLFLLEQEEESAVFHALALAGRELREPLSAIMHTSNRLFSEKSEDPTDNIHIARLNRATMQILRIACNMSDAGQFARSKPPVMQIENITELLDELFAKVSALAEHSGREIRYSGISEKIFIPLNAQALERGVQNILGNALKYTPEGGIIQAKLQRKGNKLLLSIQDNGCGIAESVRGNLFSRHTREPGLEDNLSGIGLGLVITCGAVKQHGGTVLVDQPGECGTRVTLTLPIRSGDTALLRSPILQVDYAAEQDHGLVELSDVLPAELYGPQ